MYTIQFMEDEIKIWFTAMQNHLRVLFNSIANHQNPAQALKDNYDHITKLNTELQRISASVDNQDVQQKQLNEMSKNLYGGGYVASVVATVKGASV